MADWLVCCLSLWNRRDWTCLNCYCSLFFLCSSPLVRSLTRLLLIFISSHEMIHDMYTILYLLTCLPTVPCLSHSTQFFLSFFLSTFSFFLRSFEKTENNTYVIPILLLLLLPLLIHIIASQKVMIYSTAIRSSLRNVCFE